MPGPLSITRIQELRGDALDLYEIAELMKNLTLRDVTLSDSVTKGGSGGTQDTTSDSQKESDTLTDKRSSKKRGRTDDEEEERKNKKPRLISDESSMEDDKESNSSEKHDFTNTASLNGDSSEDPTPPLKRKRTELPEQPNTNGTSTDETDEDSLEATLLRKIRASVAFSESSQPKTVFVNTLNVNVKPKRFTLLVWNVENYGRFKAEANPYANRLIRHVLDDLDVDLALFLETQGAPADVIAALEHITRKEFATSREKKKTGGMDITDKKRFTAEEKREFAQEGVRRRDQKGFAKLMESLAEGDVRFFPLSSEITGKVHALPDFIGAYVPKTSRVQKVAYFKKQYSYVGNRLEPAWISYLEDLTRLYDLRLRDAGASSDSLELEDHSKPLNREQLTMLRKAVKALCFDERDIEYLRNRRANSMFDDDDTEERNKYIDHILKELRKHYPEDSDAIRFFKDRKNDRSGDVEMTDVDVKDLKQRLKDNCDERLDLLKEIEDSVLFTLRDSTDCSCLEKGLPSAFTGFNRSRFRKTGPKRVVIGITNEGLTCYLNAALQLLACTGVPQQSSKEQLTTLAADKENYAAPTALAARAIIGLLCTQAAGGSYNYGTLPTDSTQQDTERIYLDGTTRALRQNLLDRFLIDRASGVNEDSATILGAILSGFFAGPQLSRENDDNSFDAVENTPALLKRYYMEQQDQGRMLKLPSEFSFVVCVRQTYADTKEKVTDAKLHTVEVDEDMEFRKYDLRSELLLEFGARKDATTEVKLQQLLLRYADLDTSSATGTESKCYQDGDRGAFYGRVTRERTDLASDAPSKLLVQLKRFEWLGHRESRKIPNEVKIGEEETFFGAEYELQGFIRHIGGRLRSTDLKSGHYVSYCQYEGVWYRLDDSQVTPKPDDLEEARNNAYVYYFTKKD